MTTVELFDKDGKSVEKYNVVAEDDTGTVLFLQPTRIKGKTITANKTSLKKLAEKNAAIINGVL
jgi:hypothetical protein